MKKYLIYYFVNFLLLINAQEYQPLLVEGNVWRVHKITDLGGSCVGDDCDFIYGSSDITYVIAGDSLINSITYKKIIAENIYGNTACFPFQDTLSLLREDINLKKVYKWNPIENNEYILYDFSLQVGDYYPENSEIYNGLPINLIDHGTVFNRNVRAINFYYFQEGNYIERFDIYEGIGSANGLFFPPNGLPFECGFWLECFETSTEISCNSEYLNSDDEYEPTFNKMVLYYSKTDQNFKIISSAEGNLYISIFSSNGNLMASKTIMANQNFSLPLTQKGTYFYQIKDSNNTIWKGKIMYN